MVSKLGQTILAVTVTFAATSVCAASITWRFSGTVATVDANLGTEVEFGDPWELDVTFDDTAAPSGDFGENFKIYNIIETSLTLYGNSGPLTATSTETSLTHGMSIQNNNGGRDFFTIDAGSDLAGFSLNGHAIRSVNLSLSDFTERAFDSAAIPTAIDLNSFGQKQGFAQFGVSGDDVTFNFSNFAVVPEPSYFGLGAATLLAVGIIRVRRKKS